MLLKLGVDISKLCDECRRATAIIEKAYPDFVVTCTGSGVHTTVASFHYFNRAFDIRWETYHAERIQVEVLKQRLPAGFDIVGESTHIHIEWDPKEGEI